MKIKFNRTILLIIFLALAFVTAVVLLLLTPKQQRPVVPGIVVTPSATPTTAQPTISVKTQYQSLLDISWVNLSPVVLPSSMALIKITPAPISSASMQPLLQQFNIPGTPTIINSPYVHLATWSSTNNYLTVNYDNSEISFGLNDQNNIKSAGSPKAASTLVQETIKLVNSLNLFPQGINFQLIGTEYFKSGKEYLAPATPNQSNIVILTFIPYFNNYPVYMQENSFLQATYDRSNQLVKLTINKPFAVDFTLDQRPSITFEQLQKRSAASFFRLYVHPESPQEYFYQAPDPETISPDQAVPAYLLDSTSLTLQPIIAVTVSQKNFPLAIYATSAFP